MKAKRFGPRITISLDKEAYQELNKIAESHRISVSWLTRYAIDELLSQCRKGQKIELAADEVEQGR